MALAVPAQVQVRMEAWEYINHDLQYYAVNQIYLESALKLIAFQSRDTYSGWHGKWSEDTDELVLQFDFDGREPWKTVILRRNASRAHVWRGFDHRSRRITMRLLARYVRTHTGWQQTEAIKWP